MLPISSGRSLMLVNNCSLFNFNLQHRISHNIAFLTTPHFSQHRISHNTTFLTPQHSHNTAFLTTFVVVEATHSRNWEHCKIASFFSFLTCSIHHNVTFHVTTDEVHFHTCKSHSDMYSYTSLVIPIPHSSYTIPHSSYTIPHSSYSNYTIQIPNISYISSHYPSHNSHLMLNIIALIFLPHLHTCLGFVPSLFTYAFHSHLFSDLF